MKRKLMAGIIVFGILVTTLLPTSAGTFCFPRNTAVYGYCTSTGVYQILDCLPTVLPEWCTPVDCEGPEQ